MLNNKVKMDTNTMTNTSLSIKPKPENFLGYAVVFGFWMLSLIISFSATNKEALEHYHISLTGLRMIQIGILLPTLLIWTAMLFAIYSFYHYSKQIDGSKDSFGFRNIAYGLTAVLVSSIVISLISGLRILMSEASADPASTQRHFIIISNYVSVISALAIYGYLYKGSRALLSSIGKQLSIKSHYVKTLLPIVLVSVVYLYLIFINPARQFSNKPLVNPTFGLPDSLIILTVAVPYIISWFLGMLALAGIYQYQAKTKGIVYKKLLKQLVIGMTLVISLTITLQLITQFSAFWASTGIGLILGIIVAIYIILIVAYLLVAKGARQLNSIETYELRKTP